MVAEGVHQPITHRMRSVCNHHSNNRHLACWLLVAILLQKKTSDEHDASHVFVVFCDEQNIGRVSACGVRFPKSSFEEHAVSESYVCNRARASNAWLVVVTRMLASVRTVGVTRIMNSQIYTAQKDEMLIYD